MKNEEERSAASKLLHSSFSIFRFSFFIRPTGEHELDRRALAGFGSERQLAAVGIDDAADDGQAEPGAAAL